MLGYLSADIICSEKRTVFPERSSRKTVSPRDAFRPIARERKYLMDYKYIYKYHGTLLFNMAPQFQFKLVSPPQVVPRLPLSLCWCECDPLSQSEEFSAPGGHQFQTNNKNIRSYFQSASFSFANCLYGKRRRWLFRRNLFSLLLLLFFSLQ